MMMLLAAGSCVVGVEVYFGAGGSEESERGSVFFWEKDTISLGRGLERVPCSN